MDLQSTETRTSGFSFYLNALLAGAIAGTAVDLTLFPLDTLKTRLQSKKGFARSGGFSNMYAGLSSAMLGSAPSAALFFMTYETCHRMLPRNNSNTGDHSLVLRNHMLAASIAEMAACLVRVPTDMVKQRMQAQMATSASAIIRDILKHSGVRGLFQGYSITIFRELPFACIQFPLFEYLKPRVAEYRNPTSSASPSTIDAIISGFIAGGVAAACTTPLDVIKTRTMLTVSSKSSSNNIITRVRISTIFMDLVQQEGVGALFKGVGPRVMWISIGGSIFLGMYQAAHRRLESLTSS